MLYKTTWSIAADGTLFKGAFAVVADTDYEAVEKTRAALGAEGSAASISIKESTEEVLELGRSEYAGQGVSLKGETQVSSAAFGVSVDRFAYDVAARANVVATSEEDALKKLGHKLAGKEVKAVGFLRAFAKNPEPIDEMSGFERHLLEKQFRSLRVASV